MFYMFEARVIAPDTYKEGMLPLSSLYRKELTVYACHVYGQFCFLHRLCMRIGMLT